MKINSKNNYYITKNKVNNKVLLAVFLILLSLIFSSFNIGQVCAADDLVSTDIQNKIEEQLGNINFGGFEDILNSLSDSQKGIFENKSFFEIIKDIVSGEISLDFSSVFKLIISVFVNSIIKILPVICSIIGIAILSSIITQTSYSKDKTVADIVHFVCFGLIITVAFVSVKQVISLTTDTLLSLKTQMEIGFPILLTLMISLGSTVSVSIYQPLVAVLSGSLMNIFTNFIMPLFVFCLVFSVAGNLSSNIKLNKFSSFFTSVFKWSIGLIFTIFTGFLAIQGITAASFDGLSIRTAKYAIKSYIPFVGSYLSDGLNLILTSSVLIKNAVGMAGLMLLFSTVILPLINILILKLGFLLCASVLEPICDKRITDFLSNLSKCLSMLIATICVAAFAYLITVGLIMCTSNIF